MEPKDRLRELLLELANTVNEVITENSRIKDALLNFEREGYHVDLILATITRISRKSEISSEEELKYEFSPLDKAFLNAIKIRLE
jgi:hypothetical protein